MKKYTEKDIQDLVKATGDSKAINADEIMVKLLCNECSYLFKLAEEMGDDEFLKSGFAVRLTNNMKEIWRLTKDINRDFMKEFNEKLNKIKE
jgi:hypothetical protein